MEPGFPMCGVRPSEGHSSLFVPVALVEFLFVESVP